MLCFLSCTFDYVDHVTCRCFVIDHCFTRYILPVTELLDLHVRRLASCLMALGVALVHVGWLMVFKFFLHYYKCLKLGRWSNSTSGSFLMHQLSLSETLKMNEYFSKVF